MPPPTVRVNTFVKESEKPYVDPISKVYIIAESIFGLARMLLIGKRKWMYVFPSFIIFVMLNGVVIYMGLYIEEPSIMMVSHFTQNVFSTLLSYTRCKWMQRYYDELNKFDAETGCRPKVSIGCIRNIVQAILTCIFMLLIFMIPFQTGMSTHVPVHIIPLHIVYILEVHYIGHMLNLLIPRLKLINYYMESSLSSKKSDPNPLLKEFVYVKSYDVKLSQCRMRKLMDLYQIIVEAYDFLIEGIKWQFLVTIISAFISVLGFLFKFSLHAIRGGEILSNQILIQVGIPTILMAPLFAPCTFGDSVHNEVRKLRELLASRLYENKLDKSGRSVARALLAFTETRDLSFRLLRMLNIDISLPFKFVGLLVTYLIILLQFEKVINP